MAGKMQTLLGDYKSKGVKDFIGEVKVAEGQSFKDVNFAAMDYETININNWTGDVRVDRMVSQMITNYLRKSKEIESQLRRRKLDIVTGRQKLGRSASLIISSLPSLNEQSAPVALSNPTLTFPAVRTSRASLSVAVTLPEAALGVTAL